MPEEEPRVLRSIRSEQRCLLRFINQTTRTVDVIWVNFTGQFVKYSLLPEGQFVDINTYKTHPWIATDSVTKDNLMLNKEFVFMPKTASEFYNPPQFNNRAIPNNVRIPVHITIPVYSLRLRCLLEIRNCLKTEEDVDSLELTRQLQEDLKKLIERRNKLVLTSLLRIP